MTWTARRRRLDGCNRSTRVSRRLRRLWPLHMHACRQQRCRPTCPIAPRDTARLPLVMGHLLIPSCWLHQQAWAQQPAPGRMHGLLAPPGSCPGTASAPPATPRQHMSTPSDPAPAALPCPADWQNAKSAQQSLAWATCTHALHPRAPERLTAKAVWRGATTDRTHPNADLSSFLTQARTKVRADRRMRAGAHGQCMQREHPEGGG